MENNFKTWYQVADKKFVNIFNAFDESIKTKEFAHFCIDPDFYKTLTSVSRPKNYSPDYIQSLIAKQLRVLRKKYSYIRLAYTGGTDSHIVWLDLSPKNLTGDKAEKILEEVGIACNKNAPSNFASSSFNPAPLLLCPSSHSSCEIKLGNGLKVVSKSFAFFKDTL